MKQLGNKYLFSNVYFFFIKHRVCVGFRYYKDTVTFFKSFDFTCTCTGTYIIETKLVDKKIYRHNNRFKLHRSIYICTQIFKKKMINMEETQVFDFSQGYMDMIV